MSQQTPVSRVVPAWEAWLDRWPGPYELAAASTGDVLRQWANLGYPRRALRLKECAASIVEHHAGAVPESIDSLLSLPGIGDYTARAVACFAFGQRTPVVDINVRRVMARAINGAEHPGTPSAKRDLALAEKFLPADRGDAVSFSIALMELGAMVCTARSPHCNECPWLHSCAWVAAGKPQYPGTRPTAQKFDGTDRQVRGRIMAALRRSSGPVSPTEIDVVWPDSSQRERCMRSLLEDGLAVCGSDERYSLPQ